MSGPGNVAPDTTAASGLQRAMERSAGERGGSGGAQLASLPPRVIQLIFFALDDPGELARVSRTVHKLSKSPSLRGRWLLHRGDAMLRAWACDRTRLRPHCEADWIRVAAAAAAAASAASSGGPGGAASLPRKSVSLPRGRAAGSKVTRRRSAGAGSGWGGASDDPAESSNQFRFVERLLSGPTVVVLIGAFERGLVGASVGTGQALVECARALWSKLCELRLSTILATLLTKGAIDDDDYFAQDLGTADGGGGAPLPVVAQITTMLDEISWREATYSSLSTYKNANGGLLEVLVASQDLTGETHDSMLHLKEMVPDAVILAAKLGQPAALKRLEQGAGYDLLGLKNDLIRAGAISGQQGVINFIVEQMAGTDNQQSLNKLHEDLKALVLSNLSKDSVKIGGEVQRILGAWREDNTAIKSGAEPLALKWRLAFEVALELPSYLLARGLTDAVSVEEARAWWSPAKSICLAVRTNDTRIHDLVFSLVSQSGGQVTEEIWRDDIATGLPTDLDEARMELLKRLCTIETPHLAAQLGYDTAAHPSLVSLVNLQRTEAARKLMRAPAVRRLLDHGAMDEALLVAFGRGLLAVVSTLQMDGLGISWMDTTEAAADSAAAGDADAELAAREDAFGFLPDVTTLTTREATDALAMFAALGGQTAAGGGDCGIGSSGSGGSGGGGKGTSRPPAVTTPSVRAEASGYATPSTAPSIQFRRRNSVTPAPAAAVVAAAASELAPKPHHRLMVNPDDARWTAFLGSLRAGGGASATPSAPASVASPAAARRAGTAAEWTGSGAALANYTPSESGGSAPYGLPWMEPSSMRRQRSRLRADGASSSSSSSSSSSLSWSGGGGGTSGSLGMMAVSSSSLGARAGAADDEPSVWQEMLENLLDDGEEEGLAFYLGLGGEVPEASPRLARRQRQLDAEQQQQQQQQQQQEGEKSKVQLQDGSDANDAARLVAQLSPAGASHEAEKAF
ncbi:hypothetical protein HK405_006370 [Cladochytrium tenue]|nr:hypothetical protein HK405_006370 [Cladochytrium tenue]